MGENSENRVDGRSQGLYGTRLSSRSGEVRFGSYIKKNREGVIDKVKGRLKMGVANTKKVIERQEKI